MANMKTCKCGKENWIVIHYRHNHSAFQYPKYAKHTSVYSKIQCQKCGNVFSSKSKFVDDLPRVTGGCCYELP